MAGNQKSQSTNNGNQDAPGYYSHQQGPPPGHPSSGSNDDGSAPSMLPHPIHTNGMPTADNEGFDDYGSSSRLSSHYQYQRHGNEDRSGVPQVFDHRGGSAPSGQGGADPYHFDRMNQALPDVPGHQSNQGGNAPYYGGQHPQYQHHTGGSTRPSTPSDRSDTGSNLSYRLSTSQPGSPNPLNDHGSGSYSSGSSNGGGSTVSGYPQPRVRSRPGRSGLGGSPSGGNNPYSTLARQSIYATNTNSIHGAAAASSRTSLFGIGGANSALTSKTLTSNGKNAINMYREAAKKTNDERIQLEYAKFLLQSAESSLQDIDISGNINTTYTVYMPGDSHASAPTTPDGSMLSLPLNSQGGSGGGDSSANPQSKEAMIKEGIYWIKLLQRKGNPEASFIAGTWFEEGKYGISKDEGKANQLFSYAAKNHHAEAAFRVAQHFENKRSNNRAYSYYNMAAALGDAKSNYRMSLVYLNGELGRKVDIKKAMIFLRRASDLADTKCPDAPYTLGMIYLGNYPNKDVYQAVFKDTEEAHKLLDRAANLGSANAQYQLGLLFEFAEFNFPADPFASVTYYRMAADQGHAEAQMALSGWYLSGSEGVIEQSDKDAFEWAFEAAKKGLPRAEFGMGYYFEVGIGTIKDPNVARDWYQLAAKHGSEEAKKRLNENIIGKSNENSAALRRRVTQKRVNATKKSKKGKNGNEKESCNFM
ncbi:hypothetical protein H4219_002617 [Mycoemilia scoparia]|uniref:HCP-like protein n=1 Tax=Mycoemilia scoparia TaxID=417184 RepID=A0A9W7ZX40_9FUNG|nr:hypothetical protein H4219_002617 [Mycoemilia scoparia]